MEKGGGVWSGREGEMGLWWEMEELLGEWQV